MQIENHKEEVPFAHYEEKFRSLEPASVAERLKGVKWDGKEFFVTLLGRTYAIAHPDYAIRALDEGKLPPLPAQTFLLRYLLESRDAPAGNGGPDGWSVVQHRWVVHSALRAAFGGCALCAAAAAKPDCYCRSN